MKILIKYLGYILLISAFFRIIPITAAIIYDEPFGLFLLTSGLSLFIGLSLIMAERRMETREKTLTLHKGLMLVALSFIMISVISSISFLPHFQYNFIDALFESVSGYTTTGMSIFSSLDHLPKSLLLWRAETQWMGGMGIVMVFLFIFSRIKTPAYEDRVVHAEEETHTAMALYRAQGFSQDMEPSIRNTTRNIIMIYGIYSLLGIFFLWLFGMTLYESIGMVFTALSTGGFTLSDSFYTNNMQLVVLSVLMVIGSISFIAHNKLVRLRIRNFIASFEKNVLLVMLAVFIGLGFLALSDAKTVLFEIISAFTTTGYSISDIPALPHLFIMLIMLAMIIGGSVASTSGGIKVFRVFVLLKSIPWMVKKLGSPAGAVIPFNVNKKPMAENNLLIIEMFFVTYISLLAIGTVILMILGYNFLDSSFQMTSALGTVGLQTMELAGMHWIGKITLMIAMLMGRLEIFPLFVLVRNLVKG
ncbi:hypothetical protein GF345_01405 [Candidatus Woesearchaeota archaeon]|nr:hypothetical protein [Candidatus Woesearchaeota archaeon]